MLSYGEAERRGVWLLDIEIAGEVRHYATEAQTVTTTNGDSILYLSGLGDPELSRATQGLAEASSSLELLTADDWARIEADGHTLERGRAVLRRWHEGQTLERAEVYLSGVVTGATYGEANEPMTFTLSREARNEAIELLDPQAVVSADTWPVRLGYATEDGVLGASYPLIFGCPGHNPTGTPRAAVPALMVEGAAATNASRVLISLGGIDASNVRLHNTTAGSEGTAATIGALDELGRSVTLTDFTGTTVLGELSDEYWIGLQDDATFGGGIKNPYQPGRPLRGAGDVIRYVLQTYTAIPVDTGRLSATLAELNRYQVDTWTNTPTNALDWLQSEVLEWLPVQVLESSQGLYVRPYRFDQTRADVVVWLSADRRDVERQGPLGRLQQEVFNEITVRYRPANGPGAAWYSSVTLTANAGTLSVTETDTDDPRILASYLAQRSQTVYGVRPLVLDLPQTWDDATAELVARDRLNRHAWHKRTATYAGGAELEAIEPGSCIALTDSAVHLDEALALVVDVEATSAGALLSLVLLDNPVGQPFDV
jgi:hypothetical protein